MLLPNRIRLITDNFLIPCYIFFKAYKKEVTSPRKKHRHKIETPVVLHSAGSHSPHWELVQQNSKSDAAETHHCRRRYRKNTEHSVRPPTRLHNGFLITVLNLLEGRKYMSRVYILPQFLKLIYVSFFLKVYLRSINLSKSINKVVKIGKGLTKLVQNQLQPQKRRK